MISQSIPRRSISACARAIRPAYTLWPLILDPLLAGFAQAGVARGG